MADRTCPHCGGPTDGLGRHVMVTGERPAVNRDSNAANVVRHQLQQDDESRAEQTDAEAKQLMAENPKMDYGMAVREIHRRRDEQAQLMADAVRSGVSTAQLERARQLNAKIERVQREEGLVFNDAVHRVIHDPTMRRLREEYERGE